MELKKLVLLCQHKLHMKSTTSLYSTISSALNFFLYIFYRNLKEKGHIKRNKNSKKKKCFCRKSVSKIRVDWALTTKH